MKAFTSMTGRVTIVACFLLSLLTACEKNDELEKVRLFRPVIKDALESDGNWIKASWQPIKDASSYTVQVSRDTFRTIIQSVDLDTNAYTFENLGWEVLYQVRVKAIAADTNYNSRMSVLGAIKTPRFPSILNIPAVSEITESAVKVTWTNSGAPVTTVKILKTSDNSLVQDVPLNGTDITNRYKIVTGLASSTGYTIYLYSGSTVRGWADFTTKAPFSGNLIDLRGITGRPSVLADTIPIIASGSTVILKRGETYNIASSLNINKSITILSGTDLLVPDQAVISMPANFNITSGAVIDSIVFSDVTLRGTDYASKYVFNINTACTIGKLNFINCKAEIFRGVVRTQSQPAIINNFLVDNSIIDSVAGYGVITVDVATSRCDNIVIRNSTIYKAEKIVTSRNNSVSVLIENCTVNEAPLGNSAYYVDYNTAGTNNVTNGININNCIFGIGKSNAGNRGIRGVRANAATTINGSNNYRTSDQVSLGNDVPSIQTHARPIEQLFQDPYNGNFKIIDNGFPGRSNTGDPRWRL